MNAAAKCGKTPSLLPSAGKLKQIKSLWASRTINLLTFISASILMHSKSVAALVNLEFFSLLAAVVLGLEAIVFVFPHRYPQRFSFYHCLALTVHISQQHLFNSFVFLDHFKPLRYLTASMRTLQDLTLLLNLKGHTSRFGHLEKFSLNFSSGLWFVIIRVNLLHP